MNKIVPLFEKFEEKKFTYSPTQGEITALQIIATYVGAEVFLVEEIQRVSKLLTSAYTQNDIESLDELVELGLNNSWDLSISAPQIKKPTFGIEYTLDITDTYKYILSEHNLIIPELPRLFHSLYINQFLEQFNETKTPPFIEFPDKYETRKLAMKTSNQDTLGIFSVGKIKGFGNNILTGENKSLELKLI
jgi:hypothetical protein